MSRPSPHVTHEDLGDTGRYAVTLPGIEGEGELTWHSAGPGTIVVDHTWAPPMMRGTGAAGAMVRQLIADARNKGLRIVPLCSYVRAEFDRHPDWADLRAKSGR